MAFPSTVQAPPATLGMPTPVGQTAYNQVDANGYDIINLADPTAAQGAATKNYVDASITGLTLKSPVQAVTVAAIAYVPTGSGVTKVLTAPANGLISGAPFLAAYDGVALTVGKRVLINQTCFGGAANLSCGIYTVTSVGSAITKHTLARASDSDGSPTAEFTSGIGCFVENGSVYAGSSWVMNTPDPITIDVTAVNFVQFTVVAATSPITLTGTTVGLDATKIPAIDSITTGTLTLGGAGGTNFVTLSRAGGIVGTPAQFSSTNATSSTTPGTGAILTTGGIGCGENINAQLAINATTTMQANLGVYTNLLDTISPTTLTVGGPANCTALSLGKVGAPVSVLDTTASTTTLTGCAVFKGGIGVAGAGYFGTTVAAPTSVLTPSVDTALGVTLTIGGATATRIDLGRVGCAVKILDTTVSGGTTTGSLTVAGGLGVAGVQYVGGAIHDNASADATSTSTGCIIGAGGLGLAKAIYAGGKITTADATASTSTTTGSGIFGGGIGVAGAGWFGGLVNETGVRFYAGTFTCRSGAGTQQITVGAGWAPRAIWFKYKAAALGNRTITCSGFCDQALNQYGSSTDATTVGPAMYTDASTTNALLFTQYNSTNIVTGAVSSMDAGVGFTLTYTASANSVSYDYIAMQ